MGLRFKLLSFCFLSLLLFVLTKRSFFDKANSFLPLFDLSFFESSSESSYFLRDPLYLNALRNENDSLFYANNSPRLNTTSVKQLIKDMFFHGWNNYLQFGYPRDDLMPLSCSGTKSQGDYYLTLIDAADTLAVMGELDAFEAAVNMILRIPNFNMNINVSLFETNIRVLGGLISSHLLAKKQLPNYHGGLLPLAKDLADRLLWAFNSRTGVPYGTVNLMYGIPLNETSVVCTACVTTLILEFGYLSHLLNDFKYYDAAKTAILRIWAFRSPLNLLGKHFDAETGQWTEMMSGIAGQIDSFYEYLWKAYLLFKDPIFYDMFITAYHAIETHSFHDGWHYNVHMQSGQVQNPFAYNLQAFWPGLQTMFGDFKHAAFTLSKILDLHRTYPFFPELVLIPQFHLFGHDEYPLRPEVIESVYFFYLAIPHHGLRDFGFELLKRIVHLCYTPCGFASLQSIRTYTKQDHMESFFLSETLKYFYLLFDDQHFLHHSSIPWLFTTEAHPLELISDTSAFLNYDLPLTTFNSTTNMINRTLYPRDWVLASRYWKDTWLRKQCGKQEWEDISMVWTFLRPHA